MPLVRENELLATLQESLKPFGHIMDIGCFREPTTNFFIGSGFAVLDCQHDKGNHPYQELKHIIDWASDYEYTFYATWAEMPLHCTWCHAPGHHRRDCSKLNRSLKECWSCHERGHISRECPYSNDKKRKTMGGSQQRKVKGITKGAQGRKDDSNELSPKNGAKDQLEQDNIVTDLSPNNKEKKETKEHDIQETEKKEQKYSAGMDDFQDVGTERKNCDGISGRTLGIVNNKSIVNNTHPKNDYSHKYHKDASEPQANIEKVIYEHDLDVSGKDCLTEDKDGDLIMASIEALIDEQTSVPHSDLDTTNLDYNGDSDEITNDMEFIQTLDLNTTTHTKFDKLSTLAHRQLAKKITSMSLTDTPASQKL